LIFQYITAFSVLGIFFIGVFAAIYGPTDIAIAAFVAGTFFTCILAYGFQNTDFPIVGKKKNESKRMEKTC